MKYNFIKYIYKFIYKNLLYLKILLSNYILNIIYIYFLIILSYNLLAILLNNSLIPISIFALVSKNIKLLLFANSFPFP